MTSRSLFDFESDDCEELLPDQGSALLYRRALSPLVADEAMAALVGAVPWQQHHVRVFGREVAQPRLVAWFGDPGHSYTYSGLTLRPLGWTHILNVLRSRCESLACSSFNSGLA